MSVKLKDVFTPGGQPSVTYVGREHLHLEDSIKKVIEQGYTLNVVTGPTKSGKTVLCTRVLAAGYKHVVVEGGQVRSEIDFWNNLGYQLNIAQTAVKGKTDTDGWQTAGSLTGGLPGIIGGSGTQTALGNSQKSVSATYQNSPMLASLQKLQDEGISLLVDDFHYIPADAQRALIQALKGPIYKGLSVILLAVPHRAFDPITVEDELQGRFRHVPIPPWTLEDLRLIPERGFEALNVRCPTDLQQSICEESFGNPLLVQEMCSELCAKENIFERSENPVRLSRDALTPTFETVAESKGFPKYRKLKDGPQARKDRQPRKFKDGSSADIYEALMIALGLLGPKIRTQYDEIRASLRDLLEEGQLPQKNEVTAALTQMSKIAKEKIEGEPPLEFVKEEDALVITDPFLLFYMKWQKHKISPGSTID